MMIKKKKCKNHSDDDDGDVVVSGCVGRNGKSSNTSRRSVVMATIRGILVGILINQLITLDWLLKTYASSKEFLQRKLQEGEEAASEGESTGGGGGEAGGGEGEGGASGEGGEEEGGNGEEGGEESEEEEIDPLARVSSIAIIIVVLIVITIAFETLKEVISHTSEEALQPVIESMFGELTVLGFLAVCTFLLLKAGVFKEISEAIFDEEEFLEEIFEIIHYTLFFVMIFFLLQVIYIVYKARYAKHYWDKMERYCHDEEHIQSIVKKTSRTREEEDLLLFYHLRQEFILERSLKPPFHPASKKYQVPQDFHFARYQYLTFCHAISEIVEVSPKSWATFILLDVFFWLIMLATDANTNIIEWIWLGFGWFTFGIALLFYKYLLNIKKSFAAGYNNSATGGTTATDDNNNTTMIDPALPKWCHINIKEYRNNRNLITQYIVCRDNPKPTRHHAMYLFENKGPIFHIALFQIGLIFVGLYDACLVAAFIPNVFNRETNAVAILYTIFALIPSILMTTLSNKIMRTLSVVGSIGSVRNFHAITKVIREEKTIQIVRAFLILEKMHRLATTDATSSASKQNLKKKEPSSHEEEELEEVEVVDVDIIEREVLSKLFDAFVETGTTITRQELTAMMTNFGAQEGSTSLTNLLNSLDSDHDNQITKQEFIHWYHLHMKSKDDDITLDDRAQNLFRLFDIDGDGKIELSEFKTTLDTFHLGFSIDEIVEIVKELNENGHLYVELKDFKHLIAKCIPRTET